jgi:hypothetical protein
MGDWKSEEDIKAELRDLTSELRRVREELRGMVEPAPKPNSTRAFLHKQAWPTEKRAPATAARRRSRPRRRDRG